MSNPTQNQNQNKTPQASGQQDQAQGRKDDMQNTGAQAKSGQNASDSDRDTQRKDAPKQGQNH